MPSNEPPLEPSALYAELIRRGLPADYARRTAGELDDHRADLLADLRTNRAEDPEGVADERLGATRKLARKIAADYQRRSWFGRWPLLSFLLAPPALLIACWAALIGGVAALSALLHWLDGPGMPAEYTAGRNLESAWGFYYTAIVVFSFLVPVALAWWYGRFALFGAQSRVYLLVACLSFGLMNGLVYHSVWPDPENAQRAVNGFGLMLGYPSAMIQHYAKPVQLAQLLAPLLVGGLLLARDERRRRAAFDRPFDTQTPRQAAA